MKKTHHSLKSSEFRIQKFALFFKLSLFAFIHFMFLQGCSQDEELSESHHIPSTIQQNPNVVDYTIKYKDVSMVMQFDTLNEEPVVNANYDRFNKLIDMNRKYFVQPMEGVPFGFQFFDDEEDYYIMLEKKDPQTIRKWRLGYRIEKLREKYYPVYGEDVYRYKEEVFAALKNEINQIYNDLKIASPFPEDINAFLGKRIKISELGSSRSEYFSLYEHLNGTGAELCMWTNPNVEVIVGGGPSEENYCFLWMQSPNLHLIPKSSGGHWGDCISSYCFDLPEGYLVYGYTFFRDPNYSDGWCEWLTHAPVSDGDAPNCDNSLENDNWTGGLFCKKVNDRMSSIKIKLVVDKESCEVDFSDLP